MDLPSGVAEGGLVGAIAVAVRVLTRVEKFLEAWAGRSGHPVFRRLSGPTQDPAMKEILRRQIVLEGLVRNRASEGGERGE